MNILFYDTESTSLPVWNEPSGGENQPHMVELAAALVDADTREDVALMHTIIRPDGWVIPDESMEKHGITTERALAVGAPEEPVIWFFLELWRMADLRVAYNEQFDSRIIRIATKRYCSQSTQEEWKSGAKFCAMRQATDICRIPKANGKGGYKFPKLAEAYEHFTGEEMKEQHRALPDMLACQRVYWGIKDLETKK